MQNSPWSYWQAEIAARDAKFVPTIEQPGTLDRMNPPDRIDGYYRVMGARTKADAPVAVWRDDAEADTIVQIGAQDPERMAPDSREWRDFLDTTFLKCAAVRKHEWNAALVAGRWADGKPIRIEDDVKRHDIDLSPGDNQAPLDETLADQIAALAEKLDAYPEPTTQDAANTLSGLLDKMRVLLRLAEAERVKEKEPFLQGGRDVDARWSGIKEPGEQAGIKAEARRKAFLKKEQARLEAEARAETARRLKEAEEAARAERERYAREQEEALAAEAEAAGVAVAAEEIASLAAEKAAEAVPAPVVEEVQAERARAGAAYGRASGLKKKAVAVIVDRQKLIDHLKDDEGMISYLQDRADRALRGHVLLPGVEKREDLV